MKTFGLAFVFAFVLTSGCLKVGNGTDLALVCERKTTSPWHPYAPEDLAQRTTVLTAGRNVSRDERLALLTTVAPAILTMGGAPYREFNATLQPYFEPTWVFHAWGNGTQENATAQDEYLVHVFVRADGTAELETAVVAPTTISDLATAVVARTSETQDLARTKAFGPATWDGSIPGCVSMKYDPVPPPCGPTVPACPHPTMDPRDVTSVTVNVDKGEVVSRVDGRSSTS